MKAKFVKDTLFEFEKGQDPRTSMNIGQSVKINKWFEETWGQNSWEKVPEYRINRDGTVDILSDHFSLPWRVEEIPEFIKFGNIAGDFTITRKKDIHNLDWFPKSIEGDLEFYENGIRPTKEELLAISDIKGDIELQSEAQKRERLSRQRMKERGPLKDRKSHDLRTFPTKPSRYGPKFSRGYKLYHALKAIGEAGPEGMKSGKVRALLHDLTYGEGSFDPIADRGWGSWYFSGPQGKGLQDKTERTDKKRMVLNQGGRDYIEKYKDIFEK